MTIEEIIAELLNPLVQGRVYEMATPDELARVDDVIQDFILWHIAGGQDAEYVDQTMGTHSNARVQIQAVSPNKKRASALIKAVRDTLLASDYTVGVYGSPVGTYDAARKLRGRFQQYGIWYKQ